jgi:RNA recognition motif-containing protein
VNIFVGNLSFEAKESDVQRAFAPFGKVDSVAIVMDKNGRKSRGFGFVEMPDEQGALEAIVALQGREILGRPVNVMVSLSKKQKSEPKDDKKSGAENVFSYKRTGKYKEGRRTLSYMKRRMGAGVTLPVEKRKFKANPMRWRKKSRWSTSYQKPEGESKFGMKSQRNQSRPWKKPEGESKPWEKRRGESKPWKNAEGQPKSWRKSSGSPDKLRSKTKQGFVKHKQ